MLRISQTQVFSTLFLAQSDTTAGFLSECKEAILSAKSRANKAILMEASNLEAIKTLSRLPKKFAKAIRRQSKTTFVFPNSHSFRIIKEPLHLGFLRRYGLLYSSSANVSGKRFDSKIASDLADVFVLDKRPIQESAPSRIFQIRKGKIYKIR